jgi:hypothetical protein
LKSASKTRSGKVGSTSQNLRLGSIKAHRRRHGEQKIAQFYPSQKKILEGGTKDEIRMFEEIFKGVSTLFGLRTIEKYIENLDFTFCSSFQNLRLGSINFAPTT